MCRAAIDGMKAIKNELAFRYLKGGQIKPIRADLDFRVLRRDGRVAYIDTKHFTQDQFSHSHISRDQVLRGLCYESYNVPAGFVVWLRGANETRYYSAQTIHQRGPGKSFRPEHGLLLGGLYDFSLRAIFDSTQ